MASTIRGIVKLVGKDSLRRILERSATRADGRACVWIPFWLPAARTEHGRERQRGRLQTDTISFEWVDTADATRTNGRKRNAQGSAQISPSCRRHSWSCLPCIYTPPPPIRLSSSPIPNHNNMAPTDAHHEFISKGSASAKRRLSHSGKKPNAEGYVSLTVRILFLLCLYIATMLKITDFIADVGRYFWRRRQQQQELRDRHLHP